jgi:hypothetical protein
VTALAPSRTIARGAIVEDGLAGKSRPHRGACVADVASHGGATQQINLVGDVLGGLCLGTAIVPLRHIGSVVTRGARCRGDNGMEGCRIDGKGGLASGVTLIALNCADRNMRSEVNLGRGRSGCPVTLTAIVNRGGVMDESGCWRPSRGAVTVVTRTRIETSWVSGRERLGATVIALGLVIAIVAIGTRRTRHHTVEAGGVRSEVRRAARVARVA